MIDGTPAPTQPLGSASTRGALCGDKTRVSR